MTELAVTMERNDCKVPVGFQLLLPITASYDTIRYDTIGEFNVDSKAEYSALSSAGAPCCMTWPDGVGLTL